MHVSRAASVFCLLVLIPRASAQVLQVEPQVRTKSQIDGKVTMLEVAVHFVTTIRMPETVNSVVVGDPALFQVEHSDREPELVFVKALTTRPAETNLLISTTRGHEASLLLVSRGEQTSQSQAKIDFLLRYKTAGGFLIEEDGHPTVLLGETTRVSATLKPVAIAASGRSQDQLGPSQGRGKEDGLDQLMERQERAPLPQLYGGHVDGEDNSGERVRAGVSEVIDGGQQVIVLFSVVNPTKRNILLMPPQIQLGGKMKSGKFVKHSQWSTAEQLAVMDYRLSRRRLGPGERADGVVVFERPPYKQSSETLLLQVAEAGAVDKPALAPIGFGVSSFQEDAQNGNRKSGK
jgi:hypothetical protein